MGTAISDAFQVWLGDGPRRIGQVAISRMPDGSWDLRHCDDLARDDLRMHTAHEAARHIANADDAGNYRPLKTAPTLAHGWSLRLPAPEGVKRALEYLYPAMVGVWHSHLAGDLVPVVLRDTLARQTGMYRVTQKVTDAQARETIDTFCSGCLKHRLWEIDALNPDPLKVTADALPLICHEACNLLVAEIRKVVKSAAPPAPATAIS